MGVLVVVLVKVLTMRDAADVEATGILDAEAVHAVPDKAYPALICSSLYFGYAAEMKDSCAGRTNRFPLADYGQDRVLSCGSERMR